MEQDNHETNNVFKVDVVCCKALEKRLKKDLSKLPGVNFVDILVQEGNLVLVKGKVDPSLVKATIEKLGRNAEHLSNGRNMREHAEGNGNRDNREHAEGSRRGPHSTGNGTHNDCSCPDCNGREHAEGSRRGPHSTGNGTHNDCSCPDCNGREHAEGSRRGPHSTGNGTHNDCSCPDCNGREHAEGSRRGPHSTGNGTHNDCSCPDCNGREHAEGSRRGPHSTGNGTHNDCSCPDCNGREHAEGSRRGPHSTGNGTHNDCSCPDCNGREHAEGSRRGPHSTGNGTHNDCSCPDCNGHKMEENYHTRHNRPGGRNMDENYNRFRRHVPPQADKHACRDVHCRIHNPRNMYNNDMYSRGSEGMFGTDPRFQYHGTDPRFQYHGTDPRYHGYRGGGHYLFRDDTYLHSPMMQPPCGYQFGPGRPISPYDDVSTTFNDENSGSCSIM